MITWADAHRRAAVLASEVHAELEINLGQPVDVFDAIERSGLVLAFAPLGQVSGLYLPVEPTPGVMLNQGHPRTRQRYTAGHELGHHAFEHDAEVDFDLEGGLQRGEDRTWSDHEKEAEAFGAWFLMPRRLLRAGCEQLGIDEFTGPLDVYSLSLWLGTSYTATVRQLATTRELPGPTADKWVRIPPRAMKQALAGEYVPDDLRKDVWWIEEAQSGHRLEVRPGDRLVLTLPENPSTGFSWEWIELPDGISLIADSFEQNWEPDLSDSADIDLELDGAPESRSFVIEVSPELDLGTRHLQMAKERPGGVQLAGEFEVTLSVNPPRYGLQEPESNFAGQRG